MRVGIIFLLSNRPGFNAVLFHLMTGEATRKGFYKYDEKRKASPDPEIAKYIEKSRNMQGTTPDPEVFSLFIIHFCTLPSLLFTYMYMHIEIHCATILEL